MKSNCIFLQGNVNTRGKYFIVTRVFFIARLFFYVQAASKERETCSSGKKFTVRALNLFQAEAGGVASRIVNYGAVIKSSEIAG